MPPPPEVLRIFGCGRTACPLPGGEGLSWRGDAAVLKEVHDPDEATWCQQVLADLVEDGFRRPDPMRAADGRWVVEGWTACAFLRGLRDGRPRWGDILGGAARFHHALPTPDATARRVLQQRRHRWAVADRVAWDETTCALSPAAEQVHDRIRRHLRPTALESQLIHGDLSGNVFFDRDGLPVVIDFSPYLRPTLYADAIVVGDAMLWEGAGIETLDVLGDDELSLQLLLRALIFRLVAQQLSRRPRHWNDLRAYDRALAWLGL